MLIRIRKPWDIVPANECTPESVWLNRRELLKAAAAAAFVPRVAWGDEKPKDEKKSIYPAKRNEKYKLDRPLTDERIAGIYNNFYEFSTDKEAVARLAEKWASEPWKVEVAGLCAKPRTFDLDDIRKFDHEERLYRFRCVEAWAMAVPWTGFPLAKLLEAVGPKAEAKYVRFVTFEDKTLPGVKDQPHYPWPYFEALTIAEARNELTLVTTGIYGKKLPNQHGAPVRIVVPWKYGYKSPKSIVKIELVAEKPETFWHKAQPAEYGFFSNVNPKVPHPRWSQASERLIDTGLRRDTVLYNGYGELVASLYEGMELNKPGD